MRNDIGVLPADLGLPPKFTHWRANQWEAVEEYLSTDIRFLAQCAPTGSGKSAIAMTDAMLTSGSCVVLTSTKALQTQYLSDFSETGLVEIKGKNAYKCRMDKYGRGCDFGDCNFGVGCEYQHNGCEYYDALKRARESKLIVTNYSYWLTMNFYGEGLLPKTAAGLLVLDEAHHADQHLCDVLRVHVRPREVDVTLSMPMPENLGVLGNWVIEAERKSGKCLDSMLEEYRSGGNVSAEGLRNMKSLDSRITQMSKHWNDKNWMVEFQDGVKMSPIWPKSSAEDLLFAGSKRVLLTSATVRPKTVEMLGLSAELGKGDKELKAELLRAKVESGAESTAPGCLFSDYPSIFKVENRLLLHVPTVRVNRHTSPGDYRIWLNRIDQIIAPRLHQKGIIHTVSYERRNMILNESRYADCMITHDTRGVMDAVWKFKKAKAPCILVSPSVTTGFDFPHDEARWQIIGKIGFPDTRDRLLKARMRTDPDYGAYLAMQSLVQASGRSTRGPSDSSVTFLIDDTAFWFMKKYRHFAPRWFMDGYRTSSLIPQV